MRPESVAARFWATFERSSRPAGIMAGTEAWRLRKPVGIDAAIKTIEAETCEASAAYRAPPLPRSG